MATEDQVGKHVGEYGNMLAGLGRSTFSDDDAMPPHAATRPPVSGAPNPAPSTESSATDTGPTRSISRISMWVYDDSNGHAKNIANELTMRAKNAGQKTTIGRDMVIRQWLDRLARLPWDDAEPLVTEEAIGAFMDRCLDAEAIAE